MNEKQVFQWVVAGLVLLAVVTGSIAVSDPRGISAPHTITSSGIE